MRRIRSYCLVVTFLAVGSVYAQSPTGTIAGVVTDSSGARLPAARVVITNRDNGLTRNLVASTDGDYSAAALPSGVYTVAAEANGFRRLERADESAACGSPIVELFPVRIRVQRFD